MKQTFIKPIIIFGHSYTTLNRANATIAKEEAELKLISKRLMHDTLSLQHRRHLEKLFRMQLEAIAEAKVIIDKAEKL